MGTQIANGDSRLFEPFEPFDPSGPSEPSGLSFWPRVREFAVPASMIETATARRLAGDWAGACAAAGVDVDLQLRSVVRDHGRELAACVRDDLRHLAPDLLRWHMPRIAPDGLLRPGLTLALAKYGGGGRDGGRAVHLVARTAPAWADAGQRISLALWDGVRSRGPYPHRHPHPHPRPSRRFRLDLHRHLWDARRAGELRIRAGRGFHDDDLDGPAPDLPGAQSPYGRRCAVDRWAEEARMLLRAEGRSVGAVLVRLGGRHRLVLEGVADGGGGGAGGGAGGLRIVAGAAKGRTSALPVLPDAATWVLPDLELLRAGAIEAERLHPLVASALVPESDPSSPRANRTPPTSGPVGRVGPRPVDCRGARHRIGLVDGVLAPLDHDPAEIQREELLAALTGTPLPCLQAIDEAHRRPECLPDVRERLDHGDVSGALAVVEGLLGPDAVLRDGALRDELEAAARQRITYGLFRAGLIGPGPGRIRYDDRGRTRGRRAQPRHTTRP